MGDCTSALKEWCQRMTSKVSSECSIAGISTSQTERIVSDFHKSIGWDAILDNVVPSAPLSAATWPEIVQLSANSLSSSGLNVGVDEVSAWHQNLGDIHAEDKPLGTFGHYRKQFPPALSPANARPVPLILSQQLAQITDALQTSRNYHFCLHLGR